LGGQTTGQIRRANIESHTPGHTVLDLTTGPQCPYDIRDICSNNKRKKALRELNQIYEVTAAQPWAATPITFNEKDEPSPRNNHATAALVLDPIVDGFRLTKVLMDGGSGLNLIYADTLDKMQFNRSRIKLSHTTF
jgi:hypothetical protein